MYTFFIIFSAKYLYVVSVLLFCAWVLVRKSRKEFIKLSAVALPISYILSLFSRTLYFDPRPFVSEQIVPLLQHVADNGFPSDHALLTGVLASIVFVFNKRLGILMWVVALIVGFSRVAAGIHHTIDVIGAYIIAAIGIGTSLLIIKLVQIQNKKRRENKIKKEK